MFKIFIILVFLCVYCKGADPEFRYDYKYYKDANGWLKLHFSPLKWGDARLQCYYEGAVLASPLDRKLAVAISSLIQEQRTCPDVMFSGVNALYAQGVFTSVEGVPLERMPIYWSPNEPVYLPSSCLVFYSNGTMGNKNCQDEFAFLCYKKYTGLVLNECGTVDNEYHRVIDGDTNCYKYHSVKEYWNKAYAICRAEGAHLAIIGEEKAKLLHSWLFEKKMINIAYIGIKKNFGTWWDIHGNLVNEQTDQGRIDQDCGGLTPDSQIIHARCTEKHSFLCEKAVDSLFKKDNVEVEQ